ncbi:MAG: hypothetical protein MJZ60_07050 [Bacteroidaceae bacterium]|nr:hypothetical protein [Bacteroidaceae bacterium]
MKKISKKSGKYLVVLKKVTTFAPANEKQTLLQEKETKSLGGCHSSVGRAKD